MCWSCFLEGDVGTFRMEDIQMWSEWNRESAGFKTAPFSTYCIFLLTFLCPFTQRHHKKETKSYDLQTHLPLDPATFVIIKGLKTKIKGTCLSIYILFHTSWWLICKKSISVHSWRHYHLMILWYCATKDMNKKMAEVTNGQVPIKVLKK